MTRCARCQGSLARTEADATREVLGHLFVASVPARQCKTCSAVSYEGAVLERFDLHIAASIARSGVSSGAAFRFLRKALGLRAGDIASLLDVSVETVSRWETGKRSVERASYVLLACCVRDALHGRTETLDTLRAFRAPRDLGERVVLDLTGDRAVG